MKRQLLNYAAVVILSASVTASQAQTYPSRLLQNEPQIESIIKSMTLEEKINMLHGKNMFSSAGIPRLGIADVEYADGPPLLMLKRWPRSMYRVPLRR